MTVNRLFLLLFATLLLGVESCSPKAELPEAVAVAMKALPDEVDYTLHVKPILSDRCFACHGPDQNKQKAGLRLDVEEMALSKNPESGLKAIIPGNSGSSELVKRILSTDPDYQMPTPESHLTLSTQEKATLIRWIEQGAVYKPHWAFVKPERPALPEVSHTDWPKNELDFFILHQLEAQQLTPAPEAAKTTLLRRVHLDLTGLPPTPAAIDAFLADQSADAYEKVVDGLLASPHYGERMAVPWLDLARYADTHGYQDDGLRTMWPYRDWVIKAFNQNLSFDRFITWQLAGDLLPRPTRDMLVATAFNRNHQQSQEGGIVPEEYRTEYVADRVNTFGKAFLGMTTECARCHDHKYDPISQKDYFSLFAFFNNNNENGQIPYNGEASPSLTLPSPEAEASLKMYRRQLEATAEQLKIIQKKGKPGFEEWLQQAQRQPQAALIPDTTGLAGYFNFDEPDGKALVNLANTADSARVQGDNSLTAKSVQDGKFGKSRYLFGENAITIPPPLGYYERHQPFTVSIWLRLHDDNTVGSLIHKSNGVFNGYRGWNLFREADGTIRFTLSHVWPENAIEIVSREKIPLKEWTHVVLSYDGRSKARGTRLYLNGEPAPVTILNDQLTQSLLYGKNKSNWYVDHMMIGRLSDQYTKDFQVDELKIFTRSLNPLEVKGLFTRTNEVASVLQNRQSLQNPVIRAQLYQYYLAHFHTGYRQELAAYRTLLEKETALLNTQPDVMIMKERRFPRKTFLLTRGVYDAPDYEVTAETPEHLFKMPGDFPKNRLGLARWLLHPDHPLFARVVVNRFWQEYFGDGLVATVDDFGNQGALPTHPALLDWLAVHFRESGWDVKAFQKMLVLSATYRQSSVPTPEQLSKDPDNHWYSRGPSHRISAEQIRDNALAASGLLNEQIGGESVYPYQPDGLWEALATRNAVKYLQSHGDSLYRRSMYTFWKRSSPPPMMLNFDAAERHFCTVKRQKTSTPLQALVTLNDPQFVEASRVLAQHALETLENDPETIFTYFFKALAGRAPRPVEIEILNDLYQEELADFRRNPLRAHKLVRSGEAPVNTQLPQDQLAAYAIVASTVLNFDEAIIKR